MQRSADPGWRVFWGDTHHNCYTGLAQDPPIEQVLAFAATHLDFYAGAYYTPVMTPVPPIAERLAGALPEVKGGHPFEQSVGGEWAGFRKEGIKPAERLDREWAEFQAAIRAANAPGRFVTFPGYEWQGDGTWGDHNVIYREEGLPIHRVMTLPELYARLRGSAALAIPHHVGYQTAIRAPRWECCDEAISPYAEIFSIHGCSETDEEWVGLRRNSHMGPGLAGSMWQAALDRGLHLGAIASTDNWQNMPGSWGQGLMGCLAENLTRESLWEAFRSRRVYAVTGDRIAVEFTCNGAPMGSILGSSRRRRIEARVQGWDAIDRIELLRNGRVIATHAHQGTWQTPPAGRRSRFRLRIETGWGPRPGELPFGSHSWDGEAGLADGRFLGWAPCWTGRGQTVPVLGGASARFRLVSAQSAVTNPFQVGLLLDFEADPASEFTLGLNGQTVRDPVGVFAAGSRVMWYRDDSIVRMQALTGVDAASLERQDPLFYQLAFKAKLHRAIPESGYTASLVLVDDEPLAGDANYRIRVEQRNGQRAWSSPIWVRP